ncbi:MAG: ComF family protein [Atopobiaceae bacterium]|nr:ComF family protein [Atopobiaceae bacterium]
MTVFERRGQSRAHDWDWSQSQARGRGSREAPDSCRLHHIPDSSSSQHAPELSWKDAALELLWPHRCVGCEAPQELLCETCREKLPWIVQATACPVCGAPHGWMNCTECARDWPLRTTICAWSHVDAAASAIRVYKDGGERALAPILACALEVALTEAASWPALDGRPRFDVDAVDAVCFVPATPEAYARRGADHMEIPARLLAGYLGLPLVDALARLSPQDQRSLGRELRQQNLQGSCHVVGEVSGMSFLLVDDVCTTGATLKTCAQALLDRGAREVSAACVTRVW